ncbi:FadR/GntR family transcriptional regulator [Leifsonia shinshuensis]|uniref:FadR family transcriptional regulator n=1 Tax=Leifsonia shinshuensis TaxID=150026 RepID=A0A7G6YB54_9MICO|nr:FCD domain-containing protein [Leifsonia shinshuensis]QNE35719.1 FadR family transcriptional regulator [Leifsonia shinshuensis]
MTGDAPGTLKHTAVPALTGPAVAGITRLSAVDTVRARIALAVELRLLAPGEQLPSDADVAAALDVSEITARRAIKSLAEEGLLRRVRGRSGGTFVAEASPAVAGTGSAVETYRADAEQVHRLIDQRLLAETSLSHLAAVSATDEDLAELDAAVAAASAAQDWTDYHAADERFHLAVARAAGRPALAVLYEETLRRLYAYFIPYPIAYLHEVNAEHAALAAAIRGHDPEAAVALAERHVAVLHETMFVGLEQD